LRILDKEHKIAVTSCSMMEAASKTWISLISQGIHLLVCTLMDYNMFVINVHRYIFIYTFILDVRGDGADTRT